MDAAAVGFDSSSGWGLLDIPAALAVPAGPTDPGEPNDDVDQVKPRRLFEAGEAALTSATKPSIRIAGSVDQSEDPRDVYRIWGPSTGSVNEGLGARRRDLKGTSVRAGRTGFSAYVEVLLTGRSTSARYVLGVTDAKR